MSKSSKLWAGIFFAVLIICGVAAYFISNRSVELRFVGIYQDGVLVREIDLSNVPESYEFTINGEDVSNTIHVDRDNIYIAEATCPDQVCVLHGPLTEDGAPIVCLPNSLVIRWIEEDDIDARTGI